jgi:hypothetical protein
MGWELSRFEFEEREISISVFLIVREKNETRDV